MTDDLQTQIQGRVLEVKDLPTLPRALDEVTRLIEDPNSSTEEIASVIALDQVLSAKVLKMVNSPIYGFPGRISSIQHALVLLGFNVIRGIIISTSVFDIMVKNMEGLWEHSVGCALACSAVAKQAGFKDPEEFSVAGLLHDLGKVVTAVQLSDVKEQISDYATQNDIPYFQAEKEVLGFGHDRINGWLADHWNLPLPIREAMRFHHTPEAAQHYPQYAATVHLGDFLVRVYEYGDSGDDFVSRINPKALELLKLKLEDFTPILDTLNEQFVEIADLQF